MNRFGIIGLIAIAILGALLVKALALTGTANITKCSSSVNCGPTPPPQAAAAGYTTLALNANFSKSLDIDCEGAGNETQNHMWYTGMQGTLASDCGAGIDPATNPDGPVMWPFTDPVTGDTVVNIRRTTYPTTADYQGNMGRLLGRVGISTSSYFKDLGQQYPINLYVECVERVWPLDSGYMWSNCWGIGSVENDINEFHGTASGDYGNPGPVVWQYDPAGCPCPSGAGQSISALFPNWNPDAYHAYGLLLQQTSATNMHVCEYLDDQGPWGCFDYTLTAQEQQYATQWLLSMTVGAPCCEGTWTTTDQPIIGVGSGNGTTYIDVGGLFQQNNCCMANDYGIRVSGTNTSADGYWSWVQSANRFYLYGPRSTGTSQSPCCGGGNPVPFSGSWSGGGNWNLPGGGTGGGHGYDHAFNHSAKTFRLWTCQDWQNTQCSPYNNNVPQRN